MAQEKSTVTDWPQLMFAVIAGVVMGGWAILTWSHEQAQLRDSEQLKMDALYVNPLILATKQLKSRFDNLIDNDGRDKLNKHYNTPKVGAADTIFLIAQYFAWERINYRYGPLAHDRKELKLTDRIRRTFDDSKTWSPDAFCFFRTEQQALGESVIQRAPGENGAEFHTMSFFDFAREIEDENSAIAVSSSVRKTIDAIVDTTKTSLTEGRDRVAQIRDELEQLESYLEYREGEATNRGESD